MTTPHRSASKVGVSGLAGLGRELVAGISVSILTRPFCLSAGLLGASALLAHQTFAGNPALDILAMAICVMLAGIWQMAFAREMVPPT